MSGRNFKVKYAKDQLSECRDNLDVLSEGDRKIIEDIVERLKMGECTFEYLTTEDYNSIHIICESLSIADNMEDEEDD